MLALLAALALGQQPQLYDEGTSKGLIHRLNCVGSGINCYMDGGYATVGVAGGGSVTSVSVVTANGVSGSVANATTTPAITLTLGAITPSSVASAGAVSGSNLSGTNTGDQTKTCTGQFVRALASGTSSTCESVDIADHSATGTPSAATFLRGDNTWATPAGGSSNVVEVTVAFGAGQTSASTVVTGEAWVTETSKILCVPTLLAASGRAEGAEDAVIEGVVGAVHTRAAGVGFTLTAGKPGPGLLYGSFVFHCTGS